MRRQQQAGSQWRAWASSTASGVWVAADGLGHFGFAARVTAQVQQQGRRRAAQHERLATVRLGLGQGPQAQAGRLRGGRGVASRSAPACIAHQRTGQQGLYPVGQGGGQAEAVTVCQATGPAANQASRAWGWLHQRGQREQAGPGPQVGEEQGSGHQQHRGRRVLPGHRSETSSRRRSAQPALVRPVVERGQPLCAVVVGGVDGWVGKVMRHRLRYAFAVSSAVVRGWCGSVEHGIRLVGCGQGAAAGTRLGWGRGCRTK